MSESAAATASESRPEGGRHRAREVALQVLYAIDLGRKGGASLESDEGASVGSGGDVEDAGPVVPRGPRSEMDKLARAQLTPSERATGNGLVGPVEPVLPEEVFARVTASFPVPKSALVFAKALVEAVVERAPEIDELLGAHARNWRVSRMAAVDRNVLRLAAYELRDTETPVAVIIDEAVDLARRFGSDTSPSFVNGVLDGLAREVRGR